MLELKELYKTFNPGTINAKTALNGLSLTLNDGDFVTVIGGNGAGKSTMLNAIAGVFPVDSFYPPAKRMELGAVIGAVPEAWVRREEPAPGDVVILVGGKTGRDQH